MEENKSKIKWKPLKNERTTKKYARELEEVLRHYSTWLNVWNYGQGRDQPSDYVSPENFNEYGSTFVATAYQTQSRLLLYIHADYGDDGGACYLTAQFHQGELQHLAQDFEGYQEIVVRDYMLPAQPLMYVFPSDPRSYTQRPKRDWPELTLDQVNRHLLNEAHVPYGAKR